MMNTLSILRQGALCALASLIGSFTPPQVALAADAGAAGGRIEAAHGTAHAPRRWITTWVSMPQLTEPNNLPPAPFTQPDLVLDDATLRQTVHVSLGGRHIRLRISNAFGGSALPVTAVSVARPTGGQAGVRAIQAGTSRAVTFGGRSSIVIPIGAQVVSDPIAFDVEPQSNLAITMYLAGGQASSNVTSHPGSRTTSHILAGNHVDAEDLPGATPTDHWYFISGVEVLAHADSAAVVIVGDSLTDGRGSTTNQNNRWPDLLLARLHRLHGTRHVAVLNQAAGGNRVLNDGLGPNALGRVDRDVLAQTGVRWLFVFEGVNDLGTAPAAAEAQQQAAADLIWAFDQIITRAQAHGIRVYGATLLPFFGMATTTPTATARRHARRSTAGSAPAAASTAWWTSMPWSATRPTRAACCRPQTWATACT